MNDVVSDGSDQRKQRLNNGRYDLKNTPHWAPALTNLTGLLMSGELVTACSTCRLIRSIVPSIETGVRSAGNLLLILRALSPVCAVRECVKWRGNYPNFEPIRDRMYLSELFALTFNEIEITALGGLNFWIKIFLNESSPTDRASRRLLSNSSLFWNSETPVETAVHEQCTNRRSLALLSCCAASESEYNSDIEMSRSSSNPVDLILSGAKWTIGSKKCVPRYIWTIFIVSDKMRNFGFFLIR